MDEAPDNSILRLIAFVNKSLSGMEKRYSSMGKRSTWYTIWTQRFHHYCFAREVRIITDHKLLVAIFIKGVATLSLRLE